jgi:twitching motility protein PilU
MNIEPLLQIMIDQSGSDLFLSVGRAPSIKVNGEIFSVGKQDLTPALTKALALKTMEAWQRDQFLSEKELNYALISESISSQRLLPYGIRRYGRSPHSQ